jgi:hypothetical protein
VEIIFQSVGVTAMQRNQSFVTDDFRIRNYKNSQRIMNGFKNNSMHSLLLLLGWTIGPFLFVAFFVALVTILGWPRPHATGWILTMGQIGMFLVIFLPVVLGFLCFVKLYKPKEVQWLIVFPYFFIYGIGCFAESIVVAITLGATK